MKERNNYMENNSQEKYQKGKQNEKGKGVRSTLRARGSGLLCCHDRILGFPIRPSDCQHGQERLSMQKKDVRFISPPKRTRIQERFV